jgi:hypothetical protein
MQLARVRPTRVYRFYRGGALIDRLRGELERDTDHPEDWIGSVVAANNPGRDEAFAGLTRLEDGPLLRDGIRERPTSWGTPDVLVKLLDHVDDRPEPAGRFAVLLVLEGSGELDGQPARAGDVFVVPAAMGAFDVRGDLRVLRCTGGTA